MASTAESIPTSPGIASDHPVDTFSDEKDHKDMELQAPTSLSDEDSLSRPPMSKPRLILLFFGYDPPHSHFFCKCSSCPTLQLITNVLPPLSFLFLKKTPHSLFLGSFLASLDISIIATALPRIASDFNAQTEMSWIATAYMLAYTALQPVYGRISDIFGRKIMYQIACVIFLVGSIGCGVASSMTMLILFRAVQGLGGSGLFSLVMIIIADMFTKVEERARYQSVVWLAFAVSSVLGPLLGGVFVEHATWRWCFYINLPLVSLSFVLITWLFNLPFESEKSKISEKLARIDYLGVVLVVGSVICLLLALTWGGTMYPWNSGQIIALFCIFVVLIVVLMWVEGRAKEPVVPPSLFKDRDVALVLLVSAVIGFVFMGCTYYIPLYLQVVQGVSTTVSGIRLMPSVIGLVISTTLASFLMKRFSDVRLFIWIGLCIFGTGVGLMILFGVDTPVAEQVGFVLIMGFGQGLVFQNCLFSCQELADKKDLAVVTSLCGFINSIGCSIGVAVCAAVINNRLLDNLAKLPEALQVVIREANAIENMTAVATLPDAVKGSVLEAYAESFRFLFTIFTPIVGFGLLASLFIRRKRNV